MKNALIVVNYNDYETTTKLIDNIKNYSLLDKIIIVDNNSKDNSYNQLKKIANKKIVVVKNKSNTGYGSGINFGTKFLDNIDEYNIIVSNADIEIDKESDLKKLIRNLNDNEDIAVVAPIIREHAGYNRGWKIPSPFVDAILNIAFIHRYLRKILLFYKKDFYNQNLVNVEVVSGCFFIIKGSILKKIDYFDENIFLYYEENALATKLKKYNQKTVIDTTVEVFHNHSVTIDKNINRINKFKILKKSQIYFQKNYNNANKFDIILLNMTNKITLGILYIVIFFKGGLKK